VTVCTQLGWTLSVGLLPFFFFCAAIIQSTALSATMRNTQVFAGSSHPELTALVCRRLGIPVADATLKKFSNRETSVEICEFSIVVSSVLPCVTRISLSFSQAQPPSMII
jgi:hypothetical protein